MRKLASIQIVSDVAPIEGADFIQQATVHPRTVVVKKGEFSPGDKCVFFEIDSLLPDCPWAEFMRKHHFVVRTVRLQKVLAQGLALPVAALDRALALLGIDLSGPELRAELLEPALSECLAEAPHGDEGKRGAFFVCGG